MKIDYATKVTDISGTETDLDKFRGQVLLIVNTAVAVATHPNTEALKLFTSAISLAASPYLAFHVTNLAIRNRVQKKSSRISVPITMMLRSLCFQRVK